MFKPRFSMVMSLIVAAAVTRLVPHPWNFTPVAGIALFSGAYVSDRRWALAVPLAALFASDLLLGWHATVPFVYGSFALTVLIGRRMRHRIDGVSVLGGALTASLLFFIVTNFGYWLFQSTFPKTIAGLAACYVAAIPFFQNTLVGDVLFTAALFSGVHLAVRAFPVLREPCKSI